MKIALDPTPYHSTHSFLEFFDVRQVYSASNTLLIPETERTAAS